MRPLFKQLSADKSFSSRQSHATDTRNIQQGDRRPVRAAVIWLVTWYIHIQRDLDKKRMEMAADPTKNNMR
ncbi:MAG: hypothetical protein H7Z38_19900 [Rubrivivax sp.]|nr:hypothetical protein [Pyrinomonadaceae bacterium]